MNADLLAKKRGLRIVETVVPSDGAGVLDEIEVRLMLQTHCSSEHFFEPASSSACCAAHFGRRHCRGCMYGSPMRNARDSTRALTPLLAAPLLHTPGGHWLQQEQVLLGGHPRRPHHGEPCYH